jgi:hypothetical protein
MEFPEFLYINEPIEGKLDEPFDAYTTWADSEDDETIAVYRLEKVCRLKTKTQKLLVDEEAMHRWPSHLEGKDIQAQTEVK